LGFSRDSDFLWMASHQQVVNGPQRVIQLHCGFSAQRKTEFKKWTENRGQIGNVSRIATAWQLKPSLATSRSQTVYPSRRSRL
jgi:hypothetical protein